VCELRARHWWLLCSSIANNIYLLIELPYPFPRRRCSTLCCNPTRATGDLVVDKATFEATMAKTIDKEAFDTAIEWVINKISDHIKKTNIDFGTIRQEHSRPNTKIDNVQTQVLEKRGSFDSSSPSSSGKYGLPSLPVHKLRFSKFYGAVIRSAAFKSATNSSARRAPRRTRRFGRCSFTWTTPSGSGTTA
jgi:hypothetical protein